MKGLTKLTLNKRANGQWSGDIDSKISAMGKDEERNNLFEGLTFGVGAEVGGYCTWGNGRELSRMQLKVRDDDYRNDEVPVVIRTDSHVPNVVLSALPKAPPFLTLPLP